VRTRLEYSARRYYRPPALLSLPSLLSMAPLLLLYQGMALVVAVATASSLPGITSGRGRGVDLSSKAHAPLDALYPDRPTIPFPFIAGQDYIQVTNLTTRSSAAEEHFRRGLGTAMKFTALNPRC
jgi:hypothetical protein